MKKFFLIPLVALFTCVNVWADSVIAEMSVNGGTATPYATFSALQAAINGLQNTDEALVTLKKTVELTATNAFTFHVPAGKHVTLNLNGFNLTQTIEATAPNCYWVYEEANGSLTPISETDFLWNFVKDEVVWHCEGAGDAGNADIQENALIYNQGTLHIISEGNSIVQLINTGSAEVDKATTICNSGNLTIDGGIFVGPVAYVVNGFVKMPVIWNKTENGVTPVVNINGGTFLCDESRSDYNVGTYFPTITGECEMHIKGGIFSEDEMGADTKLNHPSTMAEINTDNDDKADYTAILVPYTNANITGYNSATRTNVCPDPDGMKDATLYSTPDYKNKYRYAVKPVCVVVPTGENNLVVNDDNTTDDEYTLASDDPFKFVYIEPGKTLSVPEGKTLRVNSTSGIILGGTDAKLVVAPGATVISDGDIITSSNDNIELTMDAAYKEKGKVVGKYAHLLIKAGNIQAKHPNATVKLVSVCKNLNTWQRFAIPTYQSDFTIADIERPAGVGTAFFKWQYDGEDGNWVQLTSSAAVLEPFHGYIMTNNASEDGKIYTFKGELVGNGNPRLSLQNGWNYFANSYTAPISVEAMLVGMKAKLDGEAAVWVQRNGAKNTWSDIAYADITDGGINEALLLLQPMNTFVFKASEGTFDLEYDDFVYTPVKSAKGFAAPRRAQAAAQDEDYKMAVIVLTDEEEEELLRLYEGNDFSDSFDNGYDVSKMMNEEIFNAYFVTPTLDTLSRLASDNVDNASITLDTKETTHFTLSFRNVSLKGYSLKDNVADSLITIQTGEIYEFEAEANTKYEGRFTVVKDGGETAIDNVEETKHIANGIYSVTGVYMGNNINLLPAGIYIINGKKVVK